MPSTYNVTDINPATVTANGFTAVSAQAAANKFIAQFDRAGLVNAGTGDTRTVTINGKLKNGLIFRDQTTVKVTQ